MDPIGDNIYETEERTNLTEQSEITPKEDGFMRGYEKAAEQESKENLPELSISSQEFFEGEEIPKKYAYEGENINPPLQISNIPPETRSLVIIMYDPDAPEGRFTHWVVFNIPPDKTAIPEGSKPGLLAKNDSGDIPYYGPNPPSGMHRYIFSVYALDDDLNIEENENKDVIIEAMQDRIIAKGSLMGRYEKHD